MFAFYLTTNEQKLDSELTFGYYDTSKFEGEIDWFPATYRKMFGIQLDDIIINGKSMGWCGPNGIMKHCLITVDSGTTYLSLPSFAYETIEDKIPTATKGVECESSVDFGSITWVISGKHFTLEAEEWIYPPSGDDRLSPFSFSQNSQRVV